MKIRVSFRYSDEIKANYYDFVRSFVSGELLFNRYQWCFTPSSYSRQHEWIKDSKEQRSSTPILKIPAEEMPLPNSQLWIQFQFSLPTVSFDHMRCRLSVIYFFLDLLTIQKII